MTRLRERITELIAATGPISVSDYMALCLFDPEHGYYTIREPFGAAGDFVTAPEISQMFGELIGIWVRAAWDGVGRPMPLTFAEIGPGRGTLMKDMLRTLGKLDPALVSQAHFALIENSPRLTGIQKQTLAQSAARISWHKSLDTLPEAPLIIHGNELFDAIPMRQYVRSAGRWRERSIGLDSEGNLAFMAGAGAPDPSLLPPDAADAPDGAIVELAPARVAMMDAIAGRIAAHGGAGLFIDYGHLAPGVGDTLQAVRRHRHEPVLDSPGEADLTSHVDFAALAAEARRHGLEAHLMTQGDFLLGMGLLERAGRLGAQADETVRERLRGEVERLAGPQAMGELFKVLAISRPGTVLPPFSSAS